MTTSHLIELLRPYRAASATDPIVFRFVISRQTPREALAARLELSRCRAAAA